MTGGSANRIQRSASTGLVDCYRTSGFFALRTPLLPLSEFMAWTNRANQVTSPLDPGSSGGADRLRVALSQILQDPHTADALRVASPVLADSLDGWVNRKQSRRRERIERSLVQYFARMCDRCTPFGLFAGVSLGRTGGETRLRLDGRDGYRRRSVVDLGQVSQLVRSLLGQREVREALRYWPNDTLAAIGDGYQYVESSERGGERRHKMARLDSDAALAAALDRAAGGATRAELRPALLAAVTAAGVTDVVEADVDAYLDDLMEAQVIEPELVPAVVGEDPLEQIIAALDAVPVLSAAAASVKRLREKLHQLDDYGVGAPSEAYAAVHAVWTADLRLKDTDRLLQVDLFKEAAELRLSDDVVSEVLHGAEPLWRLAHRVPDELAELKNRFRDRYDWREVPLAEAFDPERGLGAPGPDLKAQPPRAPLLAGLPRLDKGSEAGHMDGFVDAMANQLLQNGVGKLATIELDDELLDLLATSDVDPLPDALGLHFDIVAHSEESVRCGEFRVLYHGAVGPSGARMLGRFCDLDPELLGAVRSHLSDEEALAPDEIYAEIVHSPEGRLGNVVRRPHVRAVELSCSGRSRRDRDRRLTVDDLLLSLEGGRFVLRSRRDGKRVRPRLTSAHNFRRSSGMYRFLTALQHDGVCQWFGWNWRSLNTLAFLPRVTRGRSVYALARWKVGGELPAYRAIGKAATSASRESALVALIDELELPRFVRLRHGDNRLLLDIENPLCRSALADHAARRPSLILEETLGDDLEGCVSGPEGKYRNEIILPLVRKQRAPIASGEGDAGRRSGSVASARRTFSPGDEWLFFKFYTSPGAVDRLLKEIVTPLATLHQRLAPREPWFFIRYSDPEPHLRVRFRGTPEARRALDDHAARLARPFVQIGLIHRISVDTYVREVERYGGDQGSNWRRTGFPMTVSPRCSSCTWSKKRATKTHAGGRLQWGSTGSLRISDWTTRGGNA